MAKVRIKVKATPGKSRGGMIVARQVAELRKSMQRGGKPFYEASAQLNLHFYDEYGKQRPKKTQLRRLG